ncbi:hypothetical protein MLD63_03750 [Paracoccus sp. TK19116]|uniref:Protein BatD n=1 Tax=Paracoccus albicereus TaxID=2922394 RepID=A0ABT1MMN5_9RHOB|nr:hypothetical protein [Paracoccus albicereus]MCQ0969550.1 hypothetical protein [Paracoccus albicereus]
MVRMLLLMLLLAGPIAAQERDTLSLELILDPRDVAPLEGEMILATLRGIYRETITNEDLKLRAMTDFDWTRLGQDAWSDQRIDGRAARVFERRIAFYAKREGTLEILPIAHELQVLDGEGRREIVIVRSPPVRLRIEAKPQGAGDAWLPVRALELSDDWSVDPATLEDGQSVTRRLVLRALGATPEMMPLQPTLRQPWLIAFTPPEERDFQVTAQGPVTTLVWTWSLRPITGQPGVIPAVTIPYFDTHTRTPRSATIPAAQIGYGSFADNAVSGWRADLGFGAAHLAIFVATMLLTLTIALRDRTADRVIATRVLLQLRRRQDLLRLRRYAKAGDVYRFRSLARRLLQQARPNSDPHPVFQKLDASAFGPTPQANPADLDRVYLDVRQACLQVKTVSAHVC